MPFYSKFSLSKGHFSSDITSTPCGVYSILGSFLAGSKNKLIALKNVLVYQSW